MTAYEDRIREAMPELSPSFTLLADFLLDSYIQTAFLTATELAHTLDIDPATVVRFSQRLGYQGYPELQREIRKKVKCEILAEPVEEANTASEAALRAIEETIRSLEILHRSFPAHVAEELINILDESVRVIILAEGLATSPANSLAIWLEAAGYTIHLASGSPSRLAWSIAGVRRRDLVLAVEVDENTPFLAQALADARAAGAHTVALVAAPSMQATLHANLILASQSHPEPSIRQILLESIVFALVRMLVHTRPIRFKQGVERARALTHRYYEGQLD
jgi:DNA-binding MurR/RpiR family transcriptional regulator